MTDQRAVQQAAALVDAGSPAAAMQVLAPYLAVEPDDPYALCVGAQALLKLDEADRALELAHRAAALSPSDDWPIRLQTLALREQKRFAEAQHAARNSVQVNPTNWQTHYLVALADLWASKVTHHSVAAATRARELAPAEGATHRLLGSVALELGNVKLAQRSLEQALRLDPEDAVARHELSRVQLRRFRIGSALRGFLQAGRMDPTLTQTQANLATVISRAVQAVQIGVLIALFATPSAPVATAIWVVVIAAAALAWIISRGGRALWRFARTLRVTDPLLVVWASLLLISAVLVAIRPLLSLGHSQVGQPEQVITTGQVVSQVTGAPPHQELIIAAGVAFFGGVAASWLRVARHRSHARRA